MRPLLAAAAVCLAFAAGPASASANDHCPVHPRQPSHENLRCAHDTACEVAGIPYALVTGQPLYCR